MVGGASAGAGAQLAQFNLAHARWPLDHPGMAGFTDNVARMNALADRHPGLVWRHPDDGQLVAGDPRMTWTLSVWRDAAALADFAFRTVHRRFFRDRAAWFGPLKGAALVLWWQPEGARPTLAEACARKERLDCAGSGPHAFGWEAFPELRALRNKAQGRGSTARTGEVIT
ncbi:MAG: DUF3291 domain-containing protein [Rhodobacteraceae bacterium]|nr:DUF3291 domain-containing protein [Paracoccaceae bacterium]